MSCYEVFQLHPHRLNGMDIAKTFACIHEIFNKYIVIESLFHLLEWELAVIACNWHNFTKSSCSFISYLRLNKNVFKFLNYNLFHTTTLHISSSTITASSLDWIISSCPLVWKRATRLLYYFIIFRLVV